MPRKKTQNRGRYGEGAVYQKADGQWAASLRVEGRKRQYFYGKTERAVRASLKRAKDLAEQGLTLPSKQHLADFMTAWLNNDAKKGAIASGTWVSYEGHLRLHIGPAIGQIQLGKLGPEDIDHLTSQVKAKGLSPKTIRSVRATLHAALEDARRRGYVLRNVVDLTDAPKVPKPEKRTISREQLRALLDIFLDHRLAAMWLLEIATGMRKGELLGLRVADVDLEARVIYVRVQLQRDRITKEVGLRELKTQNGQRPVAIGDDLVEVLRTHLERREKERELAGTGWIESGLVFTTIQGGHLDGDNMLRTFQILASRAGLSGLTMHDLRHANSQFLAMLKVHPRVAQKRLGHSNIQTTMEIYTEVADESEREAAAMLNDLLFGELSAKLPEQAADALELDAHQRKELQLQAVIEDCTPAMLAQRIVGDYLEARRGQREAWMRDFMVGASKGTGLAGSRIAAT